MQHAMASRLRASFVVRVTADTPSMNLVRKMTLALLNMPSFSDTTMNWEKGKCVLIMWPMFCVWLKSSAASTCHPHKLRTQLTSAAGSVRSSRDDISI